MQKKLFDILNSITVYLSLYYKIGEDGHGYLVFSPSTNISRIIACVILPVCFSSVVPSI